MCGDGGSGGGGGSDEEIGCEPLLLHPSPMPPPCPGYLLQFLVFMGHGEQHSAIAHHRDLLPEGAPGGHGEALQVRL